MFALIGNAGYIYIYIQVKIVCLSNFYYILFNKNPSDLPLNICVITGHDFQLLAMIFNQRFI